MTNPTHGAPTIETMDPTEPGGRVPALSVVIAAHNAAATLGAQLEALAANSWHDDWEVVVVDNASTDATAALAKRSAKQFPCLRVVSATSGRGPAYARNVGAREAAGRSLAFCDADDVVAPGWLAAMGEALARSPFVCGPVELTGLNPSWLAESRGSTGTRGPAWFEDRFPFASSCNLGISRELFLALHGFDEKLQVGEDIELSMRLHDRNVALEFASDAVVHYRYRPTLKSTFERAVAYGAARPVIGEIWRSRGGERISQWRGARNWAWLVRHLGLLGHRAGQARWLWVAGLRVGSLRGSWTVRRLYL